MPKPLHHDPPMGATLVEWRVEEFTKYDRNRLWYTVMLGGAVAMVVYGVVSNNFLFSLIIILAGIILFLHEQEEPLMIRVALTENGVVVGNRWYPYDELDGFFIIYQPPEVKTLFIETKQLFRPRLRIPLEDRNPVEIRHTLQAFLPEDIEHIEEPLSDMIARRWRLL